MERSKAGEIGDSSINIALLPAGVHCSLRVSRVRSNPSCGAAYAAGSCIRAPDARHCRIDPASGRRAVVAFVFDLTLRRVAALGRLPRRWHLPQHPVE